MFQRAATVPSKDEAILVSEPKMVGEAGNASGKAKQNRLMLHPFCTKIFCFTLSAILPPLSPPLLLPSPILSLYLSLSLTPFGSSGFFINIHIHSTKQRGFSNGSLFFCFCLWSWVLVNPHFQFRSFAVPTRSQLGGARLGLPGPGLHQLRLSLALYLPR